MVCFLRFIMLNVGTCTCKLLLQLVAIDLFMPIKKYM